MYLRLAVLPALFDREPMTRLGPAFILLALAAARIAPLVR
jgi:hypothetical protein